MRNFKKRGDLDKDTLVQLMLVGGALLLLYFLGSKLLGSILHSKADESTMTSFDALVDAVKKIDDAQKLDVPVYIGSKYFIAGAVKNADMSAKPPGGEHYYYSFDASILPKECSNGCLCLGEINPDKIVKCVSDFSSSWGAKKEYSFTIPQFEGTFLAEIEVPKGEGVFGITSYGESSIYEAQLIRNKDKILICKGACPEGLAVKEQKREKYK